MSRTKHHKAFGKSYSAIKYFTVPVGVSWWNPLIYVNPRWTKPKLKKNYFNSVIIGLNVRPLGGYVNLCQYLKDRNVRIGKEIQQSLLI